MTVYEVLENLSPQEPIEVWDANVYNAVTRDGWHAAPGYCPWKGTVEEFMTEEVDGANEELSLYGALCAEGATVDKVRIKNKSVFLILYRWD